MFYKYLMSRFIPGRDSLKVFIAIIIIYKNRYPNTGTGIWLYIIVYKPGFQTRKSFVITTRLFINLYSFRSSILYNIEIYISI